MADDALTIDKAMPGRNTDPAADKLKLRQHCQRRKAAIILTRSSWMTDWRQVSDNLDPSRGRFNEPSTQNPNENNNRSRRSKIINSAATECVRVAVAGMSSHMTSKSRPWFKLSAPNPELEELFDVRVWLDDVTEIVTDILAKSNFYKAMPVCYTEDMMFGVVAMLMPPNDDEVIRFHPQTAGQYGIALDGNGRVDALWRSYTRTARQLVDKYGQDRLTPNIRDAFLNSPDSSTFTVDCLIERNPDEKPGMGPMGVQAPAYRPWRETTWLQGTDIDKHGVLEVGGHYEAPFVAIRWNPVGDETYSTCPGIDSLGDIKQLQYLESQKLRLLDMIAEPPLSLPDTMRALGGGSLAPRSKTYLPQTQTGAKAEVIYQPAWQALDQCKQEIAVVVDRIRSAFFYKLFLMLESLGDQTGRTAFEVAERKEEKAAVLGPTLEAVTDEGLDPVIVRTFRLAERQGKIPPAPEALDGIPLKIEYTSILAQAMKAQGTAGIERLMNFVAMAMKASGDPSKGDKFDWDQAIDEYSERVGSPASLVKDDDAVAAVRAARAKQQQQQAMLAAAPALSDAANAVKTLGEAVPKDGSLGQGIADQMRGVAA